MAAQGRQFPAHVVQVDGHIGLVGSAGGLVDAQGPLLKRQGLGMAALASEEGTRMSEQPGGRPSSAVSAWYPVAARTLGSSARHRGQVSGLSQTWPGRSARRTVRTVPRSPVRHR
jgi:hypothetical protein